MDEEYWTHLMHCSPCESFLFYVHALELDTCHLELEHFTCGPIYYLVRLFVVDKVHFVIFGLPFLLYK
jgi:hypothetical protein